jgi:hypothetical protein
MEKIDANKFLPFGVSLRDILLHSTFKGVNAKQLLRQKGIFIESNDENDTFPLLTTTLLSPFEFEVIKDKLKAKEDSEKHLTRTIDWDSDKTLIQSLPDDFNIVNLIAAAYPRYKIVAPTNFAMVNNDPDKVTMTFKCKTNNYNSNWYRTKNEFKGEITLEKVKKDNKVILQMVYTSPETHQVTEKIANSLFSHFREKNYTNKNKEEERILYNNFNNEQRVAFFISLISGSNIFDFNRITDLIIGPDPNETLPPAFDWLRSGKVKELNIKGDTLQESFFIKEREHHKFVELSEMEIQYNFNYHAAEGNCRIRIGFENYFRKRLSNIELTAYIDGTINLTENYAHVNKDNVRKFLMREFHKLKSEKYQWFMLQNLSSQYTPPVMV